jgi:hypothetical protein
MRVSVFYLMLMASTGAVGCPTCDTPTGSAVRSGIFNDTFVWTLLEVLAPFLVLELVLYGLNRYLPD